MCEIMEKFLGGLFATARFVMFVGGALTILEGLCGMALAVAGRPFMWDIDPLFLAGVGVVTILCSYGVTYYGLWLKDDDSIRIHRKW